VPTRAKSTTYLFSLCAQVRESVSVLPHFCPNIAIKRFFELSVNKFYSLLGHMPPRPMRLRQQSDDFKGFSPVSGKGKIAQYRPLCINSLPYRFATALSGGFA